MGRHPRGQDAVGGGAWGMADEGGQLPSQPWRGGHQPPPARGFDGRGASDGRSGPQPPQSAVYYGGAQSAAPLRGGAGDVPAGGIAVGGAGGYYSAPDEYGNSYWIAAGSSDPDGGPGVAYGGYDEGAGIDDSAALPPPPHGGAYGGFKRSRDDYNSAGGSEFPPSRGVGAPHRGAPYQAGPHHAAYDESMPPGGWR